MTGDELKRHMQTVLPLETLEQLAREYGVIERGRRLDIVQLVIALVLNGGTHEGGRQFDVLRRYLENGAPRVVRGAFYSWFTAPLENLLRELLRRAIAAGQAQPPLLPGILGHRRDWRIFDSTTIKLPNSADLMLEYPGAGDYAAIKIHKEFSVGAGNLVSYEFSSARNHDSPFLRIDESRRGTGLLVDMGYASLARLLECQVFDVHYVMRLKADWKPTVDRLVRARWTRRAWRHGSVPTLRRELPALERAGNAARGAGQTRSPPLPLAHRPTMGSRRKHRPKPSRGIQHREVRPRPPKREAAPLGVGLGLTKAGTNSARRTPWSVLLWRVFGVNGVACPTCGNGMVLRAVVRPSATLSVLASLERSARGPPSGVESAARA